MSVFKEMVTFRLLVLVLTVFLCFAVFVPYVEAGPVFIAAASSVKFAFEGIARRFHRKNPETQIRLTFGSSGNHFGQIKNGAPFDVFFSSDTQYPKKLSLEGLAVSGEQMIPYAYGRLVLWVTKRSRLNPEVDRIKLVLNPQIRKVAIANPRHAPYGRAAVETLKHFGLYRQVQSRLVMGENIAQTAQFAQSGSAQAGFVSLSMAFSNSMRKSGIFWEIPANVHQPVIQGLLLLRNGRNPEGAKAFVEFVLGYEGREILQRWGFKAPKDFR